uniref:Large ribosomal subunit protein uL10m n=1 Tax=Junco hyemalis TaxID=40217 RepID=A0A8C5IV05_JUNHY
VWGSVARTDAECCPAGWLPALQLLRHGSKAVTRHWKAMHFQRQKLLALTEYLPPRPALPPRCLPRPAPRQQQEDGYARVLRAQLEATLRASRMVAVCQYNAMADEDVATLRHFLRRHDIHVKFVLNEGSLQDPAVPPRGALQFPPRGALQSQAQLPFPGACIDDTILSRQGVESVARLPPLEVSQGQTVAALSVLPSQTCSLLQRGPAHLVALLEQHMRHLRGAGGAVEPPPGTGNQ